MSATTEDERVAEILRRRQARKRILEWAIWTSIAAFVCVILAAAQGREWKGWLIALGQGLLAAGGPAAVGILIGFVFGFPNATPLPRNGGGRSNAKDGATPPSTGVIPNTNLKEVSDWLTKILLGATLTQLKTIADVASKAADALGVVFGGGSTGHTIGGLVIAFFSIAGFFTGYLITSLFLPREIQNLFDDLALSPDAESIVAQLPPDKQNLVRAELKKGQQRDQATDEMRRVEEVMIASLYVDPPDGFERAIEEAETYLKDPDHPASAPIHAWLACAYGQKYRWQLHRNAKQKKLDDTREHALDHVKQALDLDPKWKDVLKGTLASSAGDNDLYAFHDDPEFKARLS
jgi:hypothetical protein